MNYTLNQIEQDMLRGNLTPQQVVDYRIYLSALYSLKEAEHDRIRALYPDMWLKIRDGKNSDKAADREWERTALGQREARLISEKRRIDKLNQALSTKWKAIEGELRNMI